ncbi:MAG: ABC transporter permease subunit [Thermoplasmatota archaeon]
MSRAIFLRTFADQARVRTWIFTALLCLIGVALVALPLYEIDESLSEGYGDAEYRAQLQEERDQFDLQMAWALFLGFPIFNAKLLLLFFAVLAGVSATASEWQDRTVFLLFSKPVSRTRIILSKMLGAYAWVAIAVLVAAIAMLITGAIMEMNTLFSFGFFVTVLWTILAMFPLVAISCVAGIYVRRGIPAVALAVAAIAIVAPLIGSTGYLVAMQDDEFAQLGVYDDDAYEDMYECEAQNRPTHTVYEARTQQQLEQYFELDRRAFAATEVCRQNIVGDTDAFFEERGVPRLRFDYEANWCIVQVYFAEADGNMPYNGYPRNHDCYGQAESSWDAREKARISKFEKPGIDAPRYLSPANLLHGWESVSGWDIQEVNGTSGETLRFSMWEIIYPSNGAGARPSPLNPYGAVVGLLIHTVLWPFLGVVGVTRRDLH